MNRLNSVVFLTAGMVLCSALANAAEEVNVYSYRQPQLIEPMFDAFTEQTGIKVNAVFIKQGMLERLQSEDLNSPADLVFTVDIGRLSDLKNAGLTQSLESREINANVPESLRDPDGHWFGLTSRARIIVSSKERVPEDAVTSYEDLGSKDLGYRVCTRSGKHPYNVALIAMMISHHSTEQAEQWLQNLKENLGRKPSGGDRAQVRAVSEGECDVAVVNHYYMYAMMYDDEQKPWAESVNVIFPNQQDRGTHMNISGMAMTKHAPNRDNAAKLMEFLASDTAQKMYAEVNGEYPVNVDIPLPQGGYLDSLGPFKRDTLKLAEVASLRAEASKLVDRVAYDE